MNDKKINELIQNKQKEIDDYYQETKIKYQQIKQELVQIEEYKISLENIWKYPIDSIMPVLCDLVSKIEKQEYDWFHDRAKISNPAHPYYWEVSEVVLLFKKNIEDNRFKIEYVRNKPDFVRPLSKFYEQITNDFIKIAYQCTQMSDIHPSYYSRLENLDFYRPLKRVSYGLDSTSIAQVSIMNEKYTYIYDFIDYCNLWQIENDWVIYRDNYKLYNKLKEIVPDFVRDRKLYK